MPNAGWVVREVPNAPLTLRMPANVEPRNEVGCYTDRTGRALYGPGWRDFCVTLVSSKDAPLGFEATNQQSLGPDCIDCMVYEEVTIERMRLGPHDVTVQFGLASGGIGHKKRRPELMVTFAIHDGETVVLHGEYGDAGDAALILGIAGTVVRAGGNDR